MSQVASSSEINSSGVHDCVWDALQLLQGCTLPLHFELSVTIEAINGENQAGPKEINCHVVWDKLSISFRISRISIMEVPQSRVYQLVSW